MNKTILNQKFEQWAKDCNVEMPLVHYSSKEGIKLPGGMVRACYDPHLNYITVYKSGLDEQVCKHEFIHYIRRQMGLNRDMQHLYNLGVNEKEIARIHQYEEGRTYYLQEQPWSKIHAELEEERKAKATRPDWQNGFTVDGNAIREEQALDRRIKIREMMRSLFGR